MRYFLLILALAFSSFACDLQEGIRQYEKGAFAKAASSYEDCLSEYPKDARVHYNMGNVRYRMGEYGLAMFHWESALSLRPSYDDAAYNIKTLKLKLFPDEAEASELTLLLKVHHFLSMQEGLLVLWFLGFIAVFLALLSQKKDSWKGLSFVGIGGVVVVAIPLLFSTGFKIYTEQFVKRAVMVKKEAGIYSGPSAKNQRIVLVKEAAILEVLTSGEEWTSVKASEDLIGFIKTSNIKEIL